MKIIPDWNAFETEVIKHNGTVLVDFYTDGCGPCRMMNPVLDEIGKERADVKIVKVDAASNFETATKFRVNAVPTFVLLQNGDVKGQFTGVRSKRDLVAWVDSNK